VERWPIFRVKVWILSLVVASCGTARMYDGPLPANRVSSVNEHNLRIFKVDFVVAPEATHLELLPGDHVLTIGRSHPLMTDAEKRVRVRLCLQMLAGHTYLMRPIFSGATWMPEFVDENTQTVVGTWPVNPAGQDCSPRRPPPVPPPVVAATPESPDTPAVTPPGSTVPTTVPAPPPAEADPTAPIAPGPTAPSPPPAPLRRAVDYEAPRHPKRRLEEEDIASSRPGTGIGFNTGFAFGGKTLVSARFQDGSTDDLAAGEGLVLTVEGAVTPFWPSGGVGFGFGGELGLKYRSVGGSNASISFTRFPAILFGQMVAPVTPRGSFVLRAGPEWDLGPSISGDGDAAGVDVSLSSHLGFMAEIGLWYRLGNISAMTGTLRFTRLQFSDPAGGDFDATSGAVLLGVLWDPR
jgi:hypothetical protein